MGPKGVGTGWDIAGAGRAGLTPNPADFGDLLWKGDHSAVFL